MTISLEDRFLGCIYGLAIGDALGYPVEFLSLNKIKNIFGEKGVQGFDSYDQVNFKASHPIGFYSDDTQMSLATANALIKTKSDDINEFMKETVKEYIAWADSPQNDRAPGNTCMAGIRNLKRGISWDKSGIPNGKGCGAAMRTAPIGLVYYHELRKSIELSNYASACTHGEPSAISAGIATALMTSFLVRGYQALELLQLANSKFYGNVNEEFNDKIKEVQSYLSLNTQGALSQLGQGWKGHEAVAMALYCFAKTPEDYSKTVLNGINIDGDSDSVGSIAGALSGAYNGLQAIPKEWITRIENRNLIDETARKLFQRSQR
jgi:ADP-ribosylglycohydrolase